MHLPRLHWGRFPCGGAACFAPAVPLPRALLCGAGWHCRSSVENLAMWLHVVFTCVVCLMVQGGHTDADALSAVGGYQEGGRVHSETQVPSAPSWCCTMPWEVAGLCWAPACSHPTGRPSRGWWPSARTAAPPFPSSKWHMVSAAQSRAPRPRGQGRAQAGLGTVLGGKGGFEAGWEVPGVVLGGSGPDNVPLPTVAGVGFGLMSGAFSMINLLADALGPGTVGIHGDSQLYFLTSAFMTMVLIFLHTFWGILFFHGCEHRRWWEITAVVVMHLAVSGSTFCNPLYVGSLVPSYLLMATAAAWAYLLSGGSAQNLWRFLLCLRSGPSPQPGS
uniref:Gamma-secretase subunit APH-1 n=1 Tax=Otus sunia TaxID=257818 RepID=A0A8C8EC03_9STRI